MPDAGAQVLIPFDASYDLGDSSQEVEELYQSLHGQQRLLPASGPTLIAHQGCIHTVQYSHTRKRSIGR